MKNIISKPELEFIGERKTPIIVVDNYAESTANIIGNAVNQCTFSPDRHTYYPGIRSPLPKAYVIACLRPFIQRLYSVYKIPQDLKPIPKDNYYSLITTKPEDLAPVQSLPHFDTLNPFLIAAIHYLNEGEYGGTGFFRHKVSQFEYIDESRKDRYFGEIEKHLHTVRDQVPGYCTADHDEYECYKIIDYKPNRLILFPGFLLHSTLVNPDTDINADPATGRLTANMFIEFQ